MDRNEAITLAKSLARKIVSGEVLPYEGAKLILDKVIYVCDEGTCDELNYISGLEDEYLEFQKEYRIEFYGKKKALKLLKETEIQIIEEARGILALEV